MSLMRELGEHLTGLERLRAMMTSDRQPGMATTLGMNIVAAEDGRVALKAPPGAHLANTNGVVQGGFAASLLDMACGYAVISKLDAGRTCSTLELKVAYHRPVLLTVGHVIAEGTVVNLGSRIGYAEARLTDDSGRLCASASSTLMLLKI
jgi:uncharacterized protein (TIGR00369 family)